jgi:hypothetical protein
MLEGIDKKYYDAVCVAEEMWEWLADTSSPSKILWPKFEKYYENLRLMNCSICTHRDNNPVNNFKLCYGCFLGDYCERDYNEWRKSNNEFERHEYAKAIYFAILEERLRIM